MEQDKNNVVMPHKWATTLAEDQITRLKKTGVYVEDVTPIRELDLDPPDATEQILGELEPIEEDLFCQMYDAVADLEAAQLELSGERFLELGQSLKDAADTAEAKERLNAVRLNDEQAVPLFRAARRASFLRECFYWTVGERLNVHDFTIGVRKGGKIVKGARKW